MKKGRIIIAAMFFGMISCVSFAQSAAPAAPAAPTAPPMHQKFKDRGNGNNHPMADAATRAQKATDRLSKALDLDATTSQKVLEANLARDKKIDEMLASGSKDQAAFQANKQQYLASMKSILSADQYTKFLEMKYQGRGGHRKGKRNRDNKQKTND